MLFDFDENSVNRDCLRCSMSDTVTIGNSPERTTISDWFGFSWKKIIDQELMSNIFDTTMYRIVSQSLKTLKIRVVVGVSMED